MFNKKSTSIHNINADKGLNNVQRIGYFLFNYLNNLFSKINTDKSIAIKKFTCQNLDEDWNKINLRSSPSRALSDLFWLNLPWDKIKQELGEINIFDTGCGSGGYGERLVKNSQERINSYKGIDIYENKRWSILQKKYSYFKFNKYNGKNVLENIPKKANLIITQSAIEHFDEDLSYFQQIKKHICQNKKNVIQIHLFPSKFCLKLYLLHGVRQYNLRTISSITRLFSDFSRVSLYKLGGKECNSLHYNFITKSLLKRAIMKKGEDMRNTKGEEYSNYLYEAIKKDIKNPQKEESFYALVIHSYGWKEEELLLDEKIL